VAKAEWGMKRMCPNCGTRYYDMRRDPIICPHCGSPFDPEALLKTRRTRAAAAAVVAAEPETDEEIEPDLGAEETPEVVEADAALPGDEAEAEDEDAEEADAEEEDEEEVLEDASELGEDEDDMAEVIENVDEDEE
jgi:uncharacterized protein (TIGR02300 family)